MLFSVEFELGNDAFVHEEFMGELAGEVSPLKVAHQLQIIVDRIKRMERVRAGDEGLVRDCNGNTVGAWEFLAGLGDEEQED